MTEQRHDENGLVKRLLTAADDDACTPSADVRATMREAADALSRQPKPAEGATPRTDANVVRGFDALRITKDEEQWVRADVARQLERELAEFTAILQKACDRDWKGETPLQTAVIAANGLHWREQRALAAERQACTFEKRTTCSFALSATGISEDTKRLDWLESNGKKGWADGFAMHPLDDGSQYVRPWRKALEAQFAPDLKDGIFLWQADIRTAIDEAMRRSDRDATENSVASTRSAK